VDGEGERIYCTRCFGEIARAVFVDEHWCSKCGAEIVDQADWMSQARLDQAREFIEAELIAWNAAQAAYVASRLVDPRPV
jgi:hypothetical protein